MKKSIIIHFVAFLYLLAGCQKVETSVEPSSGLQPIVFSASDIPEMILETKGASPVTTSNIGNINVSATKGSSSETSVFTNVSFSKSGSGTSAVWSGGKFWPASNPSYHFYAANATLTHTTSGQTVSPTDAGTDIVVGYIASPTYNSKNTLTMKHIFAQLGTLTISAPTGYTISDLKITVQPKTSGTYNLKSDSWTSVGNAGSAVYVLGTSSAGVNITTAGGNVSSSDNDLWLVPGSYTFTATYKIARGDYQPTDTWTKYATVTLTQGKNNIITGSVPASGAADIQFSVSVTNWSDNAVNNVTFGDNQ